MQYRTWTVLKNLTACTSAQPDEELRAVLEWLDLEWICAQLLSRLNGLTARCAPLRVTHTDILEVLVNITAFGGSLSPLHLSITR